MDKPMAVVNTRRSLQRTRVKREISGNTIEFTKRDGKIKVRFINSSAIVYDKYFHFSEQNEYLLDSKAEKTYYWPTPLLYVSSLYAWYCNTTSLILT